MCDRSVRRPLAESLLSNTLFKSRRHPEILLKFAHYVKSIADYAENAIDFTYFASCFLREISKFCFLHKYIKHIESRAKVILLIFMHTSL
jgi:hypothetical protein